MVYVKKIFSFIFYPIIKLIDHIKYKKKIKELQKRDPFIYKQEVVSSLKEIYIDALKTHDWNYEVQPDEKFDVGVQQKENIRSIVEQAYELKKDPAKLFYQHCPEHLYKYSADYGIRTPWKEFKMHLDIMQEERQNEYNKFII